MSEGDIYNDTGKQQKTLRDEFAMAAIHVISAWTVNEPNGPDEELDMRARNAYRVADAMMRERERKA